MRRFFGIGILSVLITGGAILLAQNDPQPQSATESLEGEMPQPQPQEAPTESPPPAGEEIQAQEGQGTEEKAGGLPEFKEGPYTYELPPKSLDNYYPPIGKRAKVYPAYMDTLGRRFYDLVVDLGAIRLNRDDAEVSYFQFKDYYEFVANLVPEWKDRFLLDEVVELGKELGFIKDSTDTTKTEEAKKDKGPKPIGATEKVSERALALIKKIEYSCQACHLTEIPRVYARYYWHTRDHKMNMATFMVRDPVTRKKVRYRVFKRELQRDFYTILRSIDKGSRKQLRKSVKRFVKRFNYNQTLCVKCHDTDPYLFTTPTIGELVSDLDKEANRRVPSKKVLRRTLASLYVQNCKGCHRVHIPTTYVQRWWYGEFDKAPEVPQPAEESKPVVSETPEETQPAEGVQEEQNTEQEPVSGGEQGQEK